MKKQISTLLIASQISAGLFSTGAFAAPTVASPEMTALEKLFALQGENLSTQQRNGQATAILAQYAATVPADGAEQRLQSALVQLGVFTSDQASAYLAEAKPLQASLNQATSEEAARAVLKSEFTRIANLHPVAAQFSGAACVGLMVAEGAAFFGGIFTIIDGHWVGTENPTCSSQDVGPVTITVTGEFGGTQSGPGELVTTTCTQPNYHPHAAEGRWITAGGIGILVGFLGLAYYASSVGCD